MKNAFMENAFMRLSKMFKEAERIYEKFGPEKPEEQVRYWVETSVDYWADIVNWMAGDLHVTANDLLVYADRYMRLYDEKLSGQVNCSKSELAAKHKIRDYVAGVLYGMIFSMTSDQCVIFHEFASVFSANMMEMERSDTSLQHLLVAAGDLSVFERYWPRFEPYPEGYKF